MIRQIPVAEREDLEQGLKRLKLRYIREVLDDVNELAMDEEPGYIDFLAYLVDQEIKNTGRNAAEKAPKKSEIPPVKDLG